MGTNSQIWVLSLISCVISREKSLTSLSLYPPSKIWIIPSTLQGCCKERSSHMGKCQAQCLVHSGCSTNTGGPSCLLVHPASNSEADWHVFPSFCFVFLTFLYFLQGIFHCNQIKREPIPKDTSELGTYYPPSPHLTKVGHQNSTLKALSTARGSSFVSRCTSEGQARWAKGRSWSLWDCRTTTHKSSTSRT